MCVCVCKYSTADKNSPSRITTCKITVSENGQ